MNARVNSALSDRMPAAMAVSMSFPRTSGLLIDTTFETGNGHPRALRGNSNMGWNLYLKLTELLSRQWGPLYLTTHQASSQS
jgi:hypothetical protein